MNTLQRAFTSGLLMAIALLGLMERASAQREPARGDLRGVIKSIDANAGTITVAFGGGRETAATEKTFTLAKNLEVAVTGFRFGALFKEGKLADLSAGANVGLSLTGDQKTVESIVVEEPTVRGTLKSVDAKKNTLTVSLVAGREAAGEEATYALAADAEIAIDDGRGRRSSIKEGKIDELAEGANVTVRLSLDKKQVTSVLAEGSMLSGIVKAIDPAKKTLTLAIRPARGDDAGEDRTVTIAREAVILIDDGKGRRLSLKEGKLDDVPVGSAVVMKLAVDQGFVMMLKADGPTLIGMLKGVDADKGTITIAIPKGRDDAEEKTLTLAKDARVTNDGNASKLGDLKVGENGPFVQLRLTLDQQRVQVVSAHQPRARE